ncbi:hypothetical protein V6N11_033634 [Hibiscus sabdariffa]|uniref:FAR1 domain-containing protein n=1 Tax=Hibiscus sabdariffa TaxID=183260 RepID=A0ABR2PYP1_9ROSI
MSKQISKQDKSPSEIDFYTNYATSADANMSNEIIPRVGMEFNTEQDVYDFYNKYAKEVGFSIRRHKGHKDQYGLWLNRSFCCSCQDHTHALASPSKRMFLRSQRTINLAQAAELEIADRSGLAPKESVEFLARKVGGIENLGFIPEDYSNYLRTRRTKEMRVGDTGGAQMPQAQFLQRESFEENQENR